MRSHRLKTCVAAVLCSGAIASSDAFASSTSVGLQMSVSFQASGVLSGSQFRGDAPSAGSFLSGGSVASAFFGPIDPPHGIVDVTGNGGANTPGGGKYVAPFLPGRTPGSVSSPVPEPATWALLCGGLMALRLGRRRQG